jgi:hypothetical protein
MYISAHGTPFGQRIRSRSAEKLPKGVRQIAGLARSRVCRSSRFGVLCGQTDVRKRINRVVLLTSFFGREIDALSLLVLFVVIMIPVGNRPTLTRLFEREGKL